MAKIVYIYREQNKEAKRMGVKICTKCKQEKDINEFRKSLCKKNNKIYYRCECKECEKNCNKKRAKQYYLLNKEEINKKNKENYHEKYKNDNNYLERKSEYGKQYRQENKENISVKRKERYKKNEEKYKEK